MKKISLALQTARRILESVVLALCLVQCSTEDVPNVNVPVLGIATATNITRTEVDVLGSIDINGSKVSECGVLYATVQSALTSSSSNDAQKKTVDPKSGTISVHLDGLTPDVTYYYCFYATSGVTEVLSDISTFRTASQETPTLGEITLISTGEKSLTLQCNILETGGSELIDYGFQYQAVGMLKWQYFSARESEETPSTFTATIDNGLNAGTTYAVRAYAVNGKGNGYSKVIECSTNELLSPIVQLFKDEATFGSDWIKVSAKIQDHGASDEIVESGFCWSTTTESPTISDSKIEVTPDANDLLTTTITGLTQNVTYYVRAYAANKIENNEMYGYSDEVLVITTEKETRPVFESVTAENITANSADVACTLKEAGNVTILERGFCWSSGTTQPNITNNSVVKIADTETAFKATLQELEANKTYYVRAYIKSMSEGKEVVDYSGATTFSTIDYEYPSFSDVTHSDITQTSAKLSATLTPGTVTIKEVGFCYSTTNSSPTVNDTKQVAEGNTPEVTITGLKADTQYYYRAYVTYMAGSKEGTSYSSPWVSSFTTLDYEYPSFSNVTTTDITQTGAKLSATITPGTVTIKEMGFCYSPTNSYPTVDDTKVVAEGNTLEVTLTGLKSNTQYYYRPYAIYMAGDTEGITYRSSYSYFTTASYTLPSITLSVTDKTFYTAQISATVSSEGEGTVTERGFCWSSSTSSPTVEEGGHDGICTVKEGEDFACTMTDLKPGTYYYVRAYIRVTVGEEKFIKYSGYRSFSTVSLTAPSVYMSSTTATLTTIAMKAYVSSNGNSEVTEVGFCWTKEKDANPENLEKHKAEMPESTNDYFSLTAEDLESNTTYYVYAYATNGVGTGFSSVTTVTMKRVPTEDDNPSPGRAQ